jgi:ketosteroid isomerase-like protein
MRKRIGLALLFRLCCVGLTAFAQTDSDETQVRKLINEFESALARKDIATVGSLLSPQIVVFENGYRNDGWEDFRDNHLIPEFRHAGSQYSTTLIKVDVSPLMAWGYSSMKRVQLQKKDAQPDVWTSYVLRKEDGKWKIVALTWSVRRTSE